MIMSLSLVLHELATNAVKHGALSTESGRVQVRWQIDAAGKLLRLNWLESGGPAVTGPKTTGYGSELIHSMTTYNLGGKLEQNFAAGGLEVGIVIPLGGASLPGED